MKKTFEEINEFLNSQLIESELERDKWFELSRNDERCFVIAEVEYQRGRINMIRHLLRFLENEG